MTSATRQGFGGRRTKAPWWQAAMVVAVLGGAGCSLDGLLKSDQLPPDVSDPAITRTPEGARAAYFGTLAQFRQMFGLVGGSFVAVTGLLTDELSVPSGGNEIDRRTMPTGSLLISDATYADLNQLRGQASQAIGLLTHFLPEQPTLAGHLYAVQAYAETFLAELFCSGIPLSTLDFDGDFTYRPGSSTTEVLTHAVALFDTALTLAGDSARFLQLARVGQARALVGLAKYAAAAAVTAPVATDYHYDLSYNNLTSGAVSAQNFARVIDYNAPSALWDLTVPNGEGFNGLTWGSSGDPRTKVTPLTMTITTTFHPDKYAVDGSSPIVLASGVEARLIEAEAALQSGSGSWLTILNALRTDGTYDTTATTPPDTLWHAGSGGVAGLAPLADPGTMAGQVDLLFRERAFWLFLTGHRQGDLRRLIRQYGRAANAMYPIGGYPGQLSYGADVTAPVPPSEQVVNPLYTGCASRGA